jgi:hypothetical protein
LAEHNPFVILMHTDEGWVVEDEYRDHTAALAWFRTLVEREYDVAFIDVEEVQNP